MQVFYNSIRLPQTTRRGWLTPASTASPNPIFTFPHAQYHPLKRVLPTVGLHVTPPPLSPHAEVNDSWNVMIGLDVNKMPRAVNAETAFMETSFCLFVCSLVNT